MKQRIIDWTDKVGAYFGVSYFFAYTTISFYLITIGAVMVLSGPNVWTVAPGFLIMLADLVYMTIAEPKWEWDEDEL